MSLSRWLQPNDPGRRLIDVWNRSRWLAVGLLTVLAACGSGARPPTHLGRTSEPAVGASGVITGTFLAVGGPFGAASDPQHGRLVIRRNGHVAMTVRVGPDGKYSFGILPGRYTVVGYSPQFHTDGKQGACPAMQPVTVRVGHTTHVDTYCQRR